MELERFGMNPDRSNMAFLELTEDIYFAFKFAKMIDGKSCKNVAAQ